MVDKQTNTNESEVDQLLGKLLGKSDKIELPVSQSNEKYQIPVRTGRAGLPISETNKPWIVGTFIPKSYGYVNPKHHDGHPAVDYAAPKGTPIYPIASGKVVEVKEYPKGGKTCKVSHEDGLVISYYAHMLQVNAVVGSTVTQNSVLGLVGNTGSAFDTGPHVHLSVKINGSETDPQSIIGKPVGSLSRKIASMIENILEKYSYKNEKLDEPALDQTNKVLSKIIDQYLDKKSFITGSELIKICNITSGEHAGKIVKELHKQLSLKAMSKEETISFLNQFVI